MFSLSLFTKRWYKPLPPVEFESEELLDEKEMHLNHLPLIKLRTWCYLFAFVTVIATVAGSVGFKLGRNVDYYPHTNLIAPIGTKIEIFKYNQTFSLEPSDISNAAWEDLIPPTGKGFIKHPVLAPERSGLAVTHQLHCLNSLRRAYYYAVDPTILPGGSGLSRPSHIRHCIDFLRQSIMCNADTNVEPGIPGSNGVSGYGFPKVCRDYESVKQWSEKWSDSGAS